MTQEKAAKEEPVDALASAGQDHARIYDEHPMAVTILLTEFFVEYLRNLYRAFDGDIALAIVLGEIGQANTRRFVQSMHPDALPLWLVDSAIRSDSTRGCNALSASMASGIARETTRRKIKELEQRGWIEPHPDGGWAATEAAGKHFSPEFNRDLSRKLLETALRIADLVNQPAGDGRG